MGEEMKTYSINQKLCSEFLGTAFLLMSIVGSGIMADNLSNGNDGVALLANSISVGATLYVLITMLGPISGAHFNPAVTLVFAIRKDVAASLALLYVIAQITGGMSGVWLTHLMFEMDILQYSSKARTGMGQFSGELIATFGLVFTILATLKTRTSAVPAAVGLYITAAIWFTSSTSLANPAVTIARSLSESFTGIRPEDMVLFICAQLVGAALASLIALALLTPRQRT